MPVRRADEAILSSLGVQQRLREWRWLLNATDGQRRALGDHPTSWKPRWARKRAMLSRTSPGSKMSALRDGEAVTERIITMSACSRVFNPSFSHILVTFKRTLPHDRARSSRYHNVNIKIGVSRSILIRTSSILRAHICAWDAILQIPLKGVQDAILEIPLAGVQNTILQISPTGVTPYKPIA